MDKEVTKSDNEIMIEIQKEIESALNKYGVIGACDINYGYALYVDWGNGRTNTERYKAFQEYLSEYLKNAIKGTNIRVLKYFIGSKKMIWNFY